MRLKSYFAGTVESAMRLAREEMGDDALLVNSRKSPPEARHLGEYEVVFATEPALPARVSEPLAARPAPAIPPEIPPVSPAPESAVPMAPPPAPEPRLAGVRGLELAAEMASLRRQMERMTAVVARSNSLVSGRRFASAEVADAFNLLTSAEVDPSLALALTRSLEKRLVARPLAGVNRLLAEIRRDEGLEASASRHLRDLLRQEIESRVKVAPEPGSESRGPRGPRTLAVVGSPGAGKTTTLAKLAITYGVTMRRPTQLVSLDACRVGAAEQLRSYAAVLGAGFQACDGVAALAQALEECRHKELVLIDTPGYAAADLGSPDDLMRLLSRIGAEIHLVLTASTKPADLSRMVDRFQCFRPARLLFTKLDETETYGVILNEALRTDLPVSFLAAGQQVPEDLEPASKARIADLVLNGRQAKAAGEEGAGLPSGPGF
jgi:flagellar biosynthesis protein FlhF